MSIRPESRGRDRPRIAFATICFLSLFGGTNEQRFNERTLDSIPVAHHTIKKVGSIAMSESKQNKVKKSMLPNRPNSYPEVTSSTTTTAPPLPLTPAQQAANEVTSYEYAEWSKVNVCEEGGNWSVSGPKYSSGLGISNVNWVAYGGEYFAQSAAIATPDEQIVIAMRIQPNAPDQNDCTGSW